MSNALTFEQSASILNAVASQATGAAQRSALAAAEQQQAQQPPQQAQQPPQQAQQPPQPPQQAQQPPQQAQQEPDIIAELREIKSAILAGAYMGAQQPATQDAESALAAIINPPDVLELLGKK